MADKERKIANLTNTWPLPEESQTALYLKKRKIKEKIEKIP